MKIIGHRGAKGLAPENTIAGFKKALEHNVDQIEFDVRVTKDGIPIIHHNAELGDASGNKLQIKKTNYQELKRHKSDLVSLKEVLDFIDGAIDLYVEVKSRVDTKPIIKVLSRYKHPYALGSKSQSILFDLQRDLPKIPKIIIEPWSGLRATYRAKQVNTNIISMNQLFLWSGFIKSMYRRGYELYAYPVNDPKRAKRWQMHGLAGVITDFPDRFTKR